MTTDNPSVDTDNAIDLEYPQKRYKFFVLFFLYAPTSVPVTFFMIVFPVMLRKSGVPLDRIGMLGLFAIPFVLKFLWAPYVDRYGSQKFGHYKIWIVITMILCMLLGVVIALITDFAGHFWLIIGLCILFGFILATQFIAVNGLAVQCLSEKERARGNSLATVGSTIGAIAGGSMLMLVSRIGYTSTMLLTLILFIPACIVLLFFKEAQHPKVFNKITFLDCIEPLKSESMRRWLMIMNLCIIGDSMIFAMLRPMLVDKGMSMDAIGFILGTIQPITFTIGAVVSAAIIARFGRKLNLISFSVANVIALSLFLLPAMNLVNNYVLLYIVGVACFVNNFKWTLIYTIFMDHSRKSVAATDFAVQVSVISLGSAAYKIASGFLAERLGYTSFIGLSLVFDIIGIIGVAIFFKDKLIKKPDDELIEVTEAEAGA